MDQGIQELTFFSSCFPDICFLQLLELQAILILCGVSKTLQYFQCLSFCFQHASWVQVSLRSAVVHYHVALCRVGSVYSETQFQ